MKVEKLVIVGILAGLAMHELAIAQNVLEIALRHAEAANATRIYRLNLVIGELSSIVDDSLQFYWNILGKDTLAENAELTFRRTAGRLRCLDCNLEFNLSYANDFICPECRGQRTQIVGGDEFALESIDIATLEEEIV